MEVEFSKDLHHNYMILKENEQSKNERYCLKMLSAEGLDGILMLDVRLMNNLSLYYYDITAKQSLSNVISKVALTGDRVRQLFLELIATLEKAYGYLLNERDFVLSSDMVYMDLNSGKTCLCYYPGYHRDIKEQLCNLIEFIMNKVDYNDKEAVLLVYNLYAACKEEGFTLDHLQELLLTKNQYQPQKGKRGSQSLVNLEPEAVTQAIGEAAYGEEAIPEGVHKPSASGRRERRPEDRKETLWTVPFLPEKVKDEQELACYPPATYLYTIGCCLAAGLLFYFCYKAKLYYNPLGNRINYSKLFAILLILFCTGGYLLTKIWDKKNKIAKLVTKQEYINPGIDWKAPEYPCLSSDQNQQGRESKALAAGKVHQGMDKIMNRRQPDLPEDEVNPTCLLNAIEPEYCCILKPLEESGYEPIIIKSFPFFIGKLRKSVDYCLEKEVVSRYHAKITKDQNQYYITDLNSTNGTFLNREALSTYQPREIASGDEISLANIKYSFEINQ